MVHDADQDMNDEYFVGRDYEYLNYPYEHEWESWIEEFTPDSCRIFALQYVLWDPSPHWNGHFSSLAVGKFDGDPDAFVLGSSYVSWYSGWDDAALACWNESTGDLRWNVGWSSEWYTNKWINDLAIYTPDSEYTAIVCAAFHSGLTEFRDISDGSLLAVSELPYRTAQLEFGNVDNDSSTEICVRSEACLRVYEMPSIPTDVEELEDYLLPEDFRLFQNYPNPFNPHTNIRFTVPAPSNVTVAIYNLLGQNIRTFEKRCEPGTHTFRWDGKNSSGEEIASGIYLYKLSAGSHKEIRKMVLIR